MIKKIILTVLLSSTFALASDLYTDTYMLDSGVTKGRILTGIPNAFPGNRLMGKRSIAHTSVYFSNGVMTKSSQEALQDLLSKKSASSYLSVIGHSAGFTYESHSIKLNPWTEFWQNIGKSKTMSDTHAQSVNDRIEAVCNYLQKNSVPANKIYNENRMDKDPISTEATNEGRLLNRRVDVTVYR